MGGIFFFECPKCGRTYKRSSDKSIPCMCGQVLEYYGKTRSKFQ